MRLDTDTALRDSILPLATVVTPNLSEARTLAGMDSIESARRLIEAARRIHDLDPSTTAKGGVELAGGDAVDVLFDGTDVIVLSAPRSAKSASRVPVARWPPQ